ncbi:MAG TPA: hypothetical protein VND19_23370 [Acetobacteraceae bacterium]|nr:hypothetical protein [Acetobacteraceae bacterium]
MAAGTAIVGGTILMSRNQSDQGGSDTGSSVDPNKLSHIFWNAGRNPDPVVSEFGSQESAFSAPQNATQRAVQSQGIQGDFETQVQIGEPTVTVRGISSGRVVGTGTAFIP